MLTVVNDGLTVYGSATLEKLVYVGNHLYAYSNASVRCDALVAIGGGLFIYPESRLIAPEIHNIGGGLSINSDVDLQKLMLVGGGLVINAKTRLDKLHMVGDYLYAFSPTRLETLTKIAGDLVINAAAVLEAPALISVGDRLVVYGVTKLDGLERIGGDLHASVDVRLPALTRLTGRLFSSEGATVEMTSLAPAGQPQNPIPSLADISYDAPPSPWTGKNWAALGTSVTIFGAYTQPLAAMLGATLNNLAVGGGSLSTSATSDPGGIYAQISNIPLDADLVTFEAGMIDFRTNATLGALYDTSIETFYGAIYRSIADTLAANARRTIIFLTPFGTTSSNFVGQWDTQNENGDRLEQFVAAIHEVCAWCGVAVIDAGQSAGIGGLTSSVYLADGVHLNPAGGLKLAHYIYDQLIGLRPHPTLPGDRSPGLGEWSLAIPTQDVLSGTGCDGITIAQDQVDFTLAEGFYFSALWLTDADQNAVEFTSLPASGNSLWILFGSGVAGWIGAGDFGNLGAQRIATFEAAHGSVNFGKLIDSALSFDANEAGMRWRVARSGNIVHIFQHRRTDDLWVQVGKPIDLNTQGFASEYHTDVKIGILANQGTVGAFLAGTYGPLEQLTP
ncbi:Lysophospholipase L1 [Sphingomonas sp. YR710]|nr:Lysophospholipase L1 [Sphingomonas sp. YR710]